MRNEGLQKTLLAGAVIPKNRIVRFGADDQHVLVSATATAKHIGVSDNLGADAIEDPIDIIFDGIALVTYGGTVAAGDMLTSDATGRAITTVTPLDRVIGFACDSGVVGDIGSVRISPHVV